MKEIIMTNCEQITEYIKQLDSVKQEKDEIKMDKIEPLTIKIINFVLQNRNQDIEPFAKIKKIYDDNNQPISGEFEQIIYLVGLLLDNLKEFHCKDRKSFIMASEGFHKRG